jgi:chemotaxis protein methyltransferase CheR
MTRAVQRVQPAAAAVVPEIAGAREFAFSDVDFRALAQVAYCHAGIALSESKRNLLYSRLSRRLRQLGLDSFGQYREHLEVNPAEIEGFINSISTNHTKFFRESHHFEHLRDHVAVPFARALRGGGAKRLRIWSAGCSTGEEPYTIAVVLRREIPDIAAHDVRILATDIDTDVLARAARGHFAMNATEDVPREYLEFFHRSGKAGERVEVDDDVREAIAFRRLNLMEEWPFRGPFDAIFCRNVMIYFDAPTKAKLVDRFTQMVRAGGWLYIGHSESLIGSHPGLQSVGRTIYRRTA